MNRARRRLTLVIEQISMSERRIPSFGIYTSFVCVYNVRTSLF